MKSEVIVLNEERKASLPCYVQPVGGFGPEGLPEPNFGFKVSGNRDETLNLDCTLEYLEQFPAIRALLPDCFEGPCRYQELRRLMEAVGIDDVPALRGCTAPLIADDMRYLPNPGGKQIRVYDYVDVRFIFEDLYAKLKLFSKMK